MLDDYTRVAYKKLAVDNLVYIELADDTAYQHLNNTCINIFPFTMASKRMALVALTALLGTMPTAGAVTLNVSTEGGNATSSIMYGLLYEVCHFVQSTIE